MDNSKDIKIFHDVENDKYNTTEDLKYRDPYEDLISSLTLGSIALTTAGGVIGNPMGGLASLAVISYLYGNNGLLSNNEEKIKD